MKIRLIISDLYVPAHDNDALIPEVWAQEALLNLENNLVITNLVHRDFENLIARQGDTVNAHRPNTRLPARKVDGDTLTPAATTTTNVPVVLNQHLYDTFIIYDGEESKSMKSLVATHLVPAVKGLAQTLDQIVATQVYNFLPNSVGRLGQGITQSTLIALREEMNSNGVPLQGRKVVLTSAQEADLLDVERLTAADKIGDDGTALREALLGRKYGFDIYLDQNMPSITNTVAPSVTTLVNNAAGYSKGDTTITVDGGTAAADLPVGSVVSIAGDDTPQIVTAIVGDPVTSITISPGLRRAVVDNAVVSVHQDGLINFGAGYAASWTKAMVTDTFTGAPASGQMVVLDALTTQVYGAIQTSNTLSTTSLTVDNALYQAVADNDVIGLGPDGEFGLGFIPEAIALVTRPLALPRPETGVRAAVVNYNGLSIRVVISYSPTAQGHIVTVDLLAGVKVLNQDLGYPMYG